jgi:hypothetical protein
MITFVNIWEDKILSPIRTFLNNEFAGSIPIYTGNFKDMGNQSIRLNPMGSDLIDNMATSETREYILDVSYTFKEKTIKKDTWEHILRQVSHIEALFHDNTSGSSGEYFDGKLLSCRINDKVGKETDIDGLNVMRWEWRGMHLGNIS